MSFSDFYGPTNTQESHAILKMALDNGIDHIDTAKVYGMGLSEERIGQFLNTLSPNHRQFFKIATKGGIDRKNFDDKGTVVFDNSKEFLICGKLVTNKVRIEPEMIADPSLNLNDLIA